MNEHEGVNWRGGRGQKERRERAEGEEGERRGGCGEDVEEGRKLTFRLGGYSFFSPSRITSNRRRRCGACSFSFDLQAVLFKW